MGEVVRLGNLLEGLKVAAAVCEGEGLQLSAGPLRHDRDIGGLPMCALFVAHTPARRHAIFENFDSDDTVARVDPANFAMAVMGPLMVVVS